VVDRLLERTLVEVSQKRRRRKIPSGIIRMTVMIAHQMPGR
jgi:hypothetical protein